MAKEILKPNYQKVEGLIIPMFPPENIRKVMNYKPKPEDVFIATYPKCGTTWMQNVVLYIYRKGQELDSSSDFHILCPFIDPKGTQSMENMPRPGSFKTHLPFTHVPYSSEAKYIYVLRNPKDCCVSMYYHTIRASRAHNHPYAEATFDNFFELFMAGEVEYGDYYDHLMSWYPHRYDKNVLFTTYEAMKDDLKSIVMKVASFLGQEYIEAIEQDNDVMNNILRFSGFDYMKEKLAKAFRHPRKKREEEDADGFEETSAEKKSPEKENICFYRKGIVGDWKNHFSVEQNDRMNKKFIERTEGTEIYDLYKPYMFL